MLHFVIDMEFLVRTTLYVGAVSAWVLYVAYQKSTYCLMSISDPLKWTQSCPCLFFDSAISSQEPVEYLMHNKL